MSISGETEYPLCTSSEVQEDRWLQTPEVGSRELFRTDPGHLPGIHNQLHGAQILCCVCPNDQ